MHERTKPTNTFKRTMASTSSIGCEIRKFDGKTFALWKGNLHIGQVVKYNNLYPLIVCSQEKLTKHNRDVDIIIVASLAQPHVAFGIRLLRASSIREANPKFAGYTLRRMRWSEDP